LNLSIGKFVVKRKLQYPEELVAAPPAETDFSWFQSLIPDVKYPFLMQSYYTQFRFLQIGSREFHTEDPADCIIPTGE